MGACNLRSIPRWNVGKLAGQWFEEVNTRTTLAMTGFQNEHWRLTECYARSLNEANRHRFSLVHTARQSQCPMMKVTESGHIAYLVHLIPGCQGLGVHLHPKPKWRRVGHMVTACMKITMRSSVRTPKICWVRKNLLWKPPDKAEPPPRVRRRVEHGTIERALP